LKKNQEQKYTGKLSSEILTPVETLDGLDRGSILEELKSNKALLLSGTKGDEDDNEKDSSGGSDSDPSGDNMDDDEIEKLIPK
jgi:hypothetical protein